MPSSNPQDLVATVKSLADPVRWQIVERLRGGPLSASQLGEGFEISAPAISRHLKVLLEGNVVDVESQGRQRVYSLRPSTIGQLSTSLQSMAGQSTPGSHRDSAARFRPAAPAKDWRVW